MPEFTPAALRQILAHINRQGRAGSRQGLIAMADALAKQAKTNASTGRHAYGTLTPARPGAGPAVISGTLRRSIGRTAVAVNPAGWETKVGLMPGRTPPYRKGRGATSSKYGLYLERGLKNGAKYPFLGPATRMANIQAVVVFKRAFESVQWRMG